MLTSPFQCRILTKPKQKTKNLAFPVPPHFLLEYQYMISAKLLQSCPTLCGPIDGNPPGSPIPGILQARTLEWATYVLIIYVLMIQIYFFSQILQNYLETVKHSLYSKFYLLEVLIRYQLLSGICIYNLLVPEPQS